jgi:AraC-like DNA-binding protein/CheY-like chemotaxis protein
MAQEPRPDRPKVLVVSDERPTRAFVVKCLSAAYHVVESKDRRAAIRAITASGRDFRVVIVSRRPVKNRTQAQASVGLVKTMYERWPWIPVVVIGRIPDRARVTGQMLVSGARTVVQEPVTAAAFRAAVTRVVGRAGKRVPSAATVPAMNRIRGFLGEHVGENLTLGELAAMATMSRSHFSHTFHAVLGMSLRDYVRDLRLERAHLLLLASRISLTAIAAESGFYDLPHLDKAFRHRLGMSPLEFRHRYNGRFPAEGARL